MSKTNQRPSGVVTAVRLRPEVRTAVQRAAQRAGLSQGQLLREAIEAYLAQVEDAAPTTVKTGAERQA